MKGNIFNRLALDIVMTILFLILIDPKNTGMTFHEIAGLTMGAMFLFHVLLNGAWVKSVTKNLFNARLKAKTRLHYLLDAASLITVGTILYTGIEISHVLFPALGGGSIHSLALIHKWASYSCLGLFAVHIALHRRFVVNAAHKLAGSLRTSFPAKTVASVAALVLVLGLLYTQVFPDYAADAETPAYQTEIAAAPVLGLQTAPTGQKEAVSTTDKPPSTVTKSSSTSGGASVAPVSSTAPSSTTQNNTTEKSVSASSTSSGDQITLNDFLGNLFCTGCDKYCSLLRPQCGTGTKQASAAVVKYEQVYKVTD